MPFFSVVIPTFNQSNFLDNAIKSVLDQSFEDFEIIIIDNFSTDETKKIVEKNNSQKIIYKRFNNGGVIGASRNLGIETSRGKWIAFLDSDDRWYKERLKILFNEIKSNKNFDVFCTNEQIINISNKAKKIWKYGPFKNNFYKHLVSDGNCLSTSASVVRKKILIDNKIEFSENKNFVTAEDYDFFVKIAFYKHKFKFIDQVLGEHSIHGSSMSSNFQLHQDAVNSVINKHTNIIYKDSIFKKFFLLRNKFTIYINELKYYLLKDKNYLKTLYLILILSLIYPDKLLKFFIKKIKIHIINK